MKSVSAQVPSANSFILTHPAAVSHFSVWANTRTYFKMSCAVYVIGHKRTS